MSKNPWNVQSIHDFNFFCCPECVYRSKEEFEFQEHALQKHEQSKTFFQNSTYISNASDEETFGDDHNFDQYIVVEPNSYCKSEVDSDPKEEPNQELLEVEAELGLENQDINMHDFDYEALNSEGEDDIGLNRQIKSVQEEKKPFLCKKEKGKYKRKKREKSFLCDECTRKFDYAYLRNRHIKAVHEGKKPFLCNDCGNAFSTKRLVVLHIESVHEGKKPFPCTICDSAFYFKAGLDNHIKLVHEGRKPFLCKDCGKAFSKEKLVNIHIESVHRGKKTFQCNICDKAFYLKTGLNKHIETVHEGKKPFLCNDCGKAFSNQQYVKKHIESVHEKKKPFQCNVCDSAFYSKGGLDRHIESVHEGKKPFLCNDCGKAFVSKNYMNFHIESVHGGKKPYEYNENDDDDKEDWNPNSKHDFTDNSCSKCEEKFDDLVDLAVHFNKKHERVNKQLKCPVCPKMLYSISVLKNHVNVTHLKRYQSQKKRPPKTIGLVSNIQCEYCPALYARKGLLDRHMKNYHPDKKIVPDENEVYEKSDEINQECSKCGKTFDDLIVLAEHFNREHDRIDNRYHCPICPNQNNQDLSQLRLHMKTAHLGLKKKCNQCNKVFTISGYRGHMQSSNCKTSEEVLKCVQCNYSSNVRRNYLKHMETVHGEKKFLCDQCDKKFAQAGKLKDHKQWVHEGIRKVKKECNLCNKTFIHPNKYVQHYQENHGKIPPEYIDKHIMCDQCSSVFLQRASLQKHIDTAHSGESTRNKKQNSL